MSHAADDQLEATEKWFVDRGIPHFIEDYSASQDIFTRAAGLLTFIFLIEVLSALNFDRWWANLLAVIGAFGLVITLWGAVNRWRGWRPLHRPTSIGPIELAVFVLVPPLVPVVFGGNVTSSAGLIAINLGLLLVIYVVTSFGLISIMTWATGRLFRQLGETLSLFARAVPLLLLFVTFLFINAEVWQVSANLNGALLWGTLGLFAVFGALFILVRLPKEVEGLGAFKSWHIVDGFCEGTPVEGSAAAIEGRPSSRRLDRVEWINVGLVVLFAQAIQVVLVGLLVGAFLVLLGLLLMPATVIESWTQIAPNVIGTSFGLLGREVQLTGDLLRVAAFLAAFSSLYFAVTAVTDPGYREEFFEEVVGDVRQAFAVRAVYLRLVDEAGGDQPKR